MTTTDLTDDELANAELDELRVAYRELRDRQGARITAALAELRATGKKTGGDVPYGYRLDRDGETLHPLRSEQRVIAAARKLREHRMSLRDIARTLADRGLRTRNGSTFDPTQIKRMIATDGSSLASRAGLSAVTASRVPGTPPPASRPSVRGRAGRTAS